MRYLTGLSDDIWSMLGAELRQGLEYYWQTAGEILGGSGIDLLPLQPADVAIERHLFSLLFLYAFWRGALPPRRRVVYVAINQCLRGMVTGCDNLLDDEYKPTLNTDLPSGGHRFRSVLDIMVSDRVLFQILTDLAAQEGVSLERMRRASRASLRALTPSGVQEAGEEAGIGARLPPEQVLSQIHHRKTGLLFQCTWAVPEALGDGEAPGVAGCKDAIYRVGMGCQVFDDLVDLIDDLRRGRHNYVASLACHQGRPAAWEKLRALAATEPTATGQARAWLVEQRDIFGQALRTARAFLESGLRDLLDARHAALATPLVQAIAARIGVEPLLALVSQNEPP